MRKSPEPGDHGFTLTELLAVIAIIGILTALLLPVLNRTRASVRRTTCSNNLRQINPGLRMYADDADDKTPRPDGTGTNRILSFTGYRQFMQSYVDPVRASSPKARLFDCPADTFFYTLYNEVNTVPLHDQAFASFSSYNFNGGNLVEHLTRFGLDASQLGIAGLRISSISNPSKTVLLAEAPAFDPYSWHQPKRPFSPENAMFRDATIW